MPIHTHKSSVANQEIPTIYKCDSNNRENQTVVADLDGTLLVGRSSFPYFVLVAFDVGGILRLLLLLLAAPLVGLLYYFISESAGIKLLVFATFAGVKVSDIESAARAVLPKHYSEDLHPVTWRVFASCGRKVVLTANPRIMVEPFLKDYLGADEVLGTEILSYKGVATGFVAGPGVVVGENKAVALRKAVGEGAMPDIGIGDRETDLPFMKLCKEKYIVPEKPWARPVTPETLPKPVIFHDGRLVKKPTPLRALLIVFWLPIGVLLSILRIFIITRCPISLCYHVLRLLGCPISVKGNRPSQLVGRGVAMVCSHRNVVDPLMVSAALRRPATSVSYSVSRITEFMSPIKTHRLTRNRSIDAKLINDILEHGSDLVMFPEGTTCRTPYLLRFSSLFAELTDRIVPVAISIKTSMFHGSTARGYKCLDPFFLFMNPFPTYEITFLDMLPADRTCGAGGRSSYEVANDIQEMIAKCLNFKCTNLTRKDKYRVLARTDGLVGQNS